MKKALKLTVFFACAIMLSGAQESANAIAKSVSERDTGKDEVSTVSMSIINKRGYEKKRKLRWYIKDSKSGKKKFMRFIEPNDLAGVTFLSIEHPNADEEQRLYRPAQRALMKIRSSRKTGSFMGTDFTYEDLEEKKFENFAYKNAGKEKVDGVQCAIVEYIPKKTSGYSKMEMFVDTKRDMPLKVLFYSEDGNKLIKTLLYEDIVEINGILIAKKLTMINHEEESKTIIKKENIKLNSGIKDSVFTINNMRR